MIIGLLNGLKTEEKRLLNLIPFKQESVLRLIRLVLHDYKTQCLHIVAKETISVNITFVLKQRFYGDYIYFFM